MKEDINRFPSFPMDVSKRNDQGDPIFWTTTVTPSKAKSLFDSRSENRAVDNKTVIQYLSDINSGEWCLNGETITIDRYGKVFDGQHRLLAISRCSKPVRVSFAMTWSPKANETIDTGRKRTFGDVLRLRGVTNYNAKSTMVRTAHVLSFFEKNKSPYDLSMRGYLSCYENYGQQDIETALRFYSRKIPKELSISNAISTFYLYLADEGYRDDASAFCELVCSGDRGTSSLNLLAQAFFSSATSKREDKKLSIKLKLLIMAKCWNSWLAGEKMGVLKIHNTPFPRIVRPEVLTEDDFGDFQFDGKHPSSNGE